MNLWPVHQFPSCPLMMMSTQCKNFMETGCDEWKNQFCQQFSGINVGSNFLRSYLHVISLSLICVCFSVDDLHWWFCVGEVSWKACWLGIWHLVGLQSERFAIYISLFHGLQTWKKEITIQTPEDLCKEWLGLALWFAMLCFISVQTDRSFCLTGCRWRWWLSLRGCCHLKTRGTPWGWWSPWSRRRAWGASASASPFTISSAFDPNDPSSKLSSYVNVIWIQREGCLREFLCLLK